MLQDETDLLSGSPPFPSPPDVPDRDQGFVRQHSEVDVVLISATDPVGNTNPDSDEPGAANASETVEQHLGLEELIEFIHPSQREEFPVSSFKDAKSQQPTTSLQQPQELGLEFKQENFVEQVDH